MVSCIQTTQSQESRPITQVSCLRTCQGRLLAPGSMLAQKSSTVVESSKTKKKKKKWRHPVAWTSTAQYSTSIVSVAVMVCFNYANSARKDRQGLLSAELLSAELNWSLKYSSSCLLRTGIYFAFFFFILMSTAWSRPFMWCWVASVYTEQCPPGWCCGNGHPHSQGLQKCLIVNVTLKFSHSKQIKTVVFKNGLSISAEPASSGGHATTEALKPQESGFASHHPCFWGRSWHPGPIVRQ